MPQMMPLNWMLMLITFMMLLYFMMMMMYYFFLYTPKKVNFKSQLTNYLFNIQW